MKSDRKNSFLSSSVKFGFGVAVVIVMNHPVRADNSWDGGGGDANWSTLNN